MGEESIGCLVASNVQQIIREANAKKLSREDIIACFPLGGQVFMIYGRKK